MGQSSTTQQRNKLNLTKQQQTIISTIKQDSCTLLSVQAVAGAGKTSTLVAISEALDVKHGLYLAFNKAIADEAKTKFPNTIECRTLHSLAYAFIVAGTSRKIKELTADDINEKGMSTKDKYEVLTLLNRFFASSSLDIEEFLADNPLLPTCYKYLHLMEDAAIDCTFGFILKRFQVLVHLNLVKLPHYDLLLLDEAGDVTACSLDLFNHIPAKKKVMVGDSCLPGKTKIKTTTGWRKLASVVKDVELMKQVKVRSYNEVNKIFEDKLVTGSIRTGQKECFLVKTTRSSLEATANHKILTPTGFKRVDELSVGSIICKDRGEHLSNIKTLLNDDQFQVVLGSVLGDGYIDYQDKEKRIGRLTLSHSSKQYNYLKWKADCFNTAPKLARTYTSSYHSPNSRLYTVTSKLFILPEPITMSSFLSLSPLGLAIWVMDDGSLRNKYSPLDTKLSITIDSNSYTYEENQLLQLMLLSNFGLEATIQKTRSYYRLSFNKVNSIKLREIISPYVGDDFLYKFKHNPSKVAPLDNSKAPTSVDIVTAITSIGIEDTFDITVKDNHNFIASKTAILDTACGIIVHNCQNINSFMHTINGFEEMAGQGIHLPLTQSFRVSEAIATQVEAFCHKYISRTMEFKGVPISNPTINSIAYLSRTNAQLIDRMIKLHQLGTKYTLLRPLESIFALPLTMANLNNPRWGRRDEFAHIYTAVDRWEASPELQLHYKTSLSYLKHYFIHDIQIQSAIALILKYGAKGVIDTYYTAKVMNKPRQVVTIATAHVSKGQEYDHVYIEDDLNSYCINAIENQYESEDTMQAYYLYYTACTRARIRLDNAQALTYKPKDI